MRKYRGFLIGLAMGGMLMTALPSMAATQKTTYTLTEASYEVEVNGAAYFDPELPVLNYKGNTYVPLRSVGDLLGANVAWDAAQRKVVIQSNGEHLCNDAFCNVKVSGSGGQYTVTGEARVFEAVMNYAVEDGHDYVLEDFHMLDEGAPAWSPFTLELDIPPDKLPDNGTLMLELFEYSAKDGSKINVISVPLETFAP
ncbi:Gmad2 immunoglobulin-like domain-containing protein [Paenibacillus soyae]|uniref:Stalk domain-containing protein n=1 Tax=Paenibacillus soyae TaxID=2969249 RepID=A0A9X2MTV7_9BACL|nr:Gmad2 immunoglobulin-like domain-containing protein [Paenibacillus soyae]MCR2806385.1 stalk domain-containing protein [Paenibacillus soyae]